jgi:magnesium and cobalt exporter, CNNM family
VRPLLLFLTACAVVYVSVVQTAFVAVLRFSLRIIAEGTSQRALSHYLEDPIRLFVPTRVALGMLNVIAAVLLARMIGVGERRSALWVFALVFAMFLLVTGHIVPQLIVRRRAQAVLEMLLPSFRLAVAPLAPLTALIVRLLEGRDRSGRTDADEEEPEAPADELDASQDSTPEQGEATEERRLFLSLVEFQDLLVREVMTPRPDIVAIRSNATIGELCKTFREQQYSRYPVYEGSLDNILGFVNVKDVLLLDDGEIDRRPITPLVRPAHVVPETKRVPELLKEMQRAHVHSALVVDEYGGTAGLVTIEDLMEEIVGEIRDEYDVEAEPVVEEDQRTFVFSGKVDIDELADRLGVDVEREGFETVGGYLLSRLGRVPAVGETFEIDGLQVQVLEAERRRILKVRVRRSLVDVQDE